MYQAMIYGGFSLAAILLIVAVVLFFKFHIAAVIGDVTGVTRKKQIRRIQQEGTAQEKDNFYSQAVGLRKSGTLRPHSGKVEKKSKSGQLRTRGKTGQTGATEPRPMKNRRQETPVSPLEQEYNTTDLESTEQLAANTAVLAEEEGATEVLAEQADATELLSQAEAALPEEKEKRNGKPADETFEILTKVISIHSAENMDE